MNVIYPSVTVVHDIDPEYILFTIEESGRICYRSAPHGDSEGFVRRLIEREATSQF